MRRRLLTLVTLASAIIAMIVAIWGLSHLSTPLVPRGMLIPLSVMLLAGGCNRYLDEKQDGLVQIVAGLFMAVVVVTTR